jgi:hypothetical protein
MTAAWLFLGCRTPFDFSSLLQLNRFFLPARRRRDGGTLSTARRNSPLHRSSAFLLQCSAAFDGSPLALCRVCIDGLDLPDAFNCDKTLNHRANLFLQSRHPTAPARTLLYLLNPFRPLLLSIGFISRVIYKTFFSWWLNPLLDRSFQKAFADRSSRPRPSYLSIRGKGHSRTATRGA